jgi:uncharacterized protein YlxW (UPF0749 family)
MKMHVPLGTPQPWVLPVTFVCLALGALLASMLRISTQERIDTSRPDQLALLYAQAKRESDDMRAEKDRIQARIDTMIESKASDEQLVADLHSEIKNLRVATGAVPVEGPGIAITIDDSKSIQPNPADVSANALLTHDVDLLLLINELRSADAEALAINDQRVVASTSIRCVGPVIHVNHQSVGTPFVVRAIGNPDNLAGAITMPYGIVDQLKQLGITVEVTKRELIRVPAVPVVPRLKEGRALEIRPAK